MDITRKIATVAVAALALGGTGAATAFASSHSPARPRVASNTRTGASHARGPANGEDNGENGNDGPGGHTDPSGNVDHQFNGVE